MESEAESTAYSFQDTYPVGGFKHKLVQEKEVLFP